MIGAPYIYIGTKVIHPRTLRTVTKFCGVCFMECLIERDIGFASLDFCRLGSVILDCSKQTPISHFFWTASWEQIYQLIKTVGAFAILCNFGLTPTLRYRKFTICCSSSSPSTFVANSNNNNNNNDDDYYSLIEPRFALQYPLSS